MSERCPFLKRIEVRYEKVVAAAREVVRSKYEETEWEPLKNSIAALAYALEKYEKEVTA